MVNGKEVRVMRVTRRENADLSDENRELPNLKIVLEVEKKQGYGRMKGEGCVSRE